MACQHGLSLVHPSISFDSNSVDDPRTNGTAKPIMVGHNMSANILNAVAAERDPNNFSSLFEMLLLYITSFRSLNKIPWIVVASDRNKNNEGGLDADAFTKSLTKILRRACYGSAADHWGPSILPLVASLPNANNRLQLQVLTGLVRDSFTFSMFACLCNSFD